MPLSLAERFEIAWTSIGGTNSKRIFNLVKANYDQGRYYHNWQHITNFFDYKEAFIPHIESSAEFDLAIFFHDVVYVPGAEDNEMKSIDFFVDCCQNVNTQSIERVKQFIVATITQTSDDPEIQYMVDMDLAGLAADVPIFDQTVRDLHKEFSMYAWDEFVQGQYQYLLRFVERESIYFTDEFRNALEDKALKNIERLGQGDVE